MDCSMLGFPVLHYLPEFAQLMSIKSIIPSNYLILCHHLLLLPSIFPSIRVFSNESTLPIRLPNYRSFSFSISPSNEYSGLVSFRMDWSHFLAVQGILKSLLHTTFWKHQFSRAQPSLWSDSHICTWLLENPQLWLDGPLSEVVALHFSTLSSFVTAFLSRSEAF